jgi:hypothetical protein
MMKRPTGCLALGVSLCLLFEGCGVSDASARADVGVAQLELREVPLGVQCLRVTAAGSRVVERRFAPSFQSQTSNFRLEGLPVGDVSFSADAFTVPCNGIGSAIPTWIGGPTRVTLAEGVLAQVTIVMVHNGRANVGLDFNDSTCALAGDTCSTDAACCGGPNLTATCQSGACSAVCAAGFADCNADKARDGCEIDTNNDVNNCGGCGNLCSVSCQGGICLNASLLVDGVTYIGFRMSTSPQVASVVAPLADGGLCDAQNPSWAGRIVLCQRGGIYFSTKAANVTASGGLAAVIYNNVPLYVLGISIDPPFPIPIAMFLQTDGQYLVANKVGVSATLLVQ